MKRWNQGASAGVGAVLAAVALLMAWGPAAAQAPTPEGTVIHNVATAHFTDANNNQYSDVSAAVDVKVGFKAGVDVSSPTAVTPTADAKDQTITYTVTNTGNGPEPIVISGVEQDANNIISNITYCYNGTCSANPADLTSLIGSVPAGGSVTIVVHYDAAPGSGGQSAIITVTGDASRDGSTATDASATTITPTLTGTVAVTPDGEAVNQLPSNGPSYSATFVVQNNQTGPVTYALTHAVAGANSASLVITGLEDCSSHAPITSVLIPAAQSKEVCVLYTVGQVAAGSTGTLQLTASAGSVTDGGAWEVKVVRPSLSITKKAYLDNAGALGTEITTEQPKPGDYLWYKVVVKNTGLANATTVSISDPLPTALEHVAHDGDGVASPAWDFSGTDALTGTIRATLASMAPDAERFIVIRVRVK